MSLALFGTTRICPFNIVMVFVALWSFTTPTIPTRASTILTTVSVFLFIDDIDADKEFLQTTLSLLLLIGTTPLLPLEAPIPFPTLYVQFVVEGTMH